MTEPFGPLSTTRYVVNGVPFDTVRVPPGRFLGGTRNHRREEIVSYPFEIGINLVSQSLWRAVTGSPCPSRYRGPDRPVEQILFRDAQAFLARLDSLGFPGFRLPLDLEWGWAARCGASTRYAGGDRAKAVVSAQAKTAPVATLLPSVVGAFDLSGNVDEILNDEPGSVGGPTLDGFHVVRAEEINTVRSSISSLERSFTVGMRLVRVRP
jgi:formylglycine-generating enzyme required for sulfatase activity